jgi:hypothetical protein
MGCNNASSRRQRAERTAAPAQRSRPRGKGRPDSSPSDEHPADADPWLSAKLDELHAAVRVADGHQGRNRTSDQDAGRPDDTATCGVLAALGRAWIDWLIEAAGDGDAAARAHLRELGFQGF